MQRADLEARAHALADQASDVLRCGHPKGPMRCTRLHACGPCPYAERLDYDLAA